MTSDHAARFIRSHGIDAWPTADPATVLVMDVTTEQTPHGIITRSVPCIIPMDPSWVRMWLGY